MAHVRAGAEVVIEQGARPVAVLHAAEPVRRTFSACIALAKVHEEETDRAPVVDADFAEDVKDILNKRKPWNPGVAGVILDMMITIRSVLAGRGGPYHVHRPLPDPAKR